jgi:hypothetical protein
MRSNQSSFYNQELSGMRADQNVDGQNQEHDSLGELAVAIADQLVVHHLSPERQTQLSKGVMDRVRKSAQIHRQFVTVRRERGVFEALASGVSVRALRSDSAVRVDLMRLDPRAQVFWPEGVHAQEILVLTGSLVDGASLSLSSHELIVRSSPQLLLSAGLEGATLYVRQVTDASQLSANERLWWDQDDVGNTHSWTEASVGVAVKVLRGHGDVVSMLVRIAAGAAVPHHAHKLDEDCMMLAGELFSGDILLRQDDYQVVPKDIDHPESVSDTGALLYIHGVMPEAA